MQSLSLDIVSPHIRIIRDINSIYSLQRRFLPLSLSLSEVSPFNKNSLTKTRRREAFPIFLSAYALDYISTKRPRLRDIARYVFFPLRYFPRARCCCNERYIHAFSTDVQSSRLRDAARNLCATTSGKISDELAEQTTEPVVFTPPRVYIRLCKRSQQRQNRPVDNKI